MSDGVCPSCESVLKRFSSFANEVAVFVHDGCNGPGTGQSYCMTCVALAVREFMSMKKERELSKKRMVINGDQWTIYNDDGSIAEQGVIDNG